MGWCGHRGYPHWVPRLDGSATAARAGPGPAWPGSLPAGHAMSQPAATASPIGPTAQGPEAVRAADRPVAWRGVEWRILGGGCKAALRPPRPAWPPRGSPGSARAILAREARLAPECRSGGAASNFNQPLIKKSVVGRSRRSKSGRGRAWPRRRLNGVAQGWLPRAAQGFGPLNLGVKLPPFRVPCSEIHESRSEGWALVSWKGSINFSIHCTASKTSRGLLRDV